ncbi:MAG: ABC transporter ATP-binding protein [Eggerthellaceae bacterium]|nr:ABC transporter ATP-binding protein [Eggerthellaceae bacterium]
MPGDAIVFDGVSFSYGDAPFIEKLDLRLQAHCVTGVVGPNGCGKSTLLKLAGGLLAPSTGTVEVAGARLGGLGAKQRAKTVALLPQDTPAVAMSVGDLALSGRYAHRGFFQPFSEEDRAAAADALALTGADSLADRQVRSLSGGQRQRAYLAMLLAQNAPVLLLDEPTSALDIRAAHDMLALVRDVRGARGATAVIVMHDLDLAFRYCDRLVVMRAGDVVAHGPSADVIEGGSIERVFAVDVTRHESPAGSAYTFAPAGKAFR